MSQWQPGQYDPRRYQQQIPYRQGNDQQPRPTAGYGPVQPYAPPQQQPWPPQGHGQPYPQQQPYWPQQQPRVAVQQNVYGPSRAVTQGKLNPIETMFHLFATIMTGGLWGFVWWARVHSKKSVTTFR